MVFQITHAGKPLFHAPVLLGRDFQTRMLHSVQLSPVEESYGLLQGKIWGRRCRTRSYNAGLPHAAPTPGRFYHQNSWFVLEGGRKAWKNIAYRVGDRQIGRNEFQFHKNPWIPLYNYAKDTKLIFSVKRQALHEVLSKPSGVWKNQAFAAEPSVSAKQQSP